MGFGAAAVPEDKNTRNPVLDLWLNPPDYESVREAFTSVGALKAEIRLLEDKIKRIEFAVKGKKRDKESLEAAEEASRNEREHLAQLEAELYKHEWTVKWYDYHKEMAKIVGFAVR